MFLIYFESKKLQIYLKINETKRNLKNAASVTYPFWNKQKK